MTRQHPVHDTINALTRTQRQRINIANTGISYQVTAPCLLEQLAAELGCSNTGTGGRTIPGSRLLVATDAWDLWREIHHSTHTWADTLDLDRRPYLPHRRRGGTGPDRPTAQRQPAGWWLALDPAAVDLITTLPPTTTTPPRPVRQTITPPRPEVPPVGRLLRLVAATAVTRGKLDMADAIHRITNRWAQRIEEMLTGRQEQRALRGVPCPADDCPALCVAHHHPARWCAADEGHCCTGCEPALIIDQVDGARQVRPTIVLTTRDVAGETLRWLTCQTCGWTRGADQLAHARFLALVADIAYRLALLLPYRPAPALEETPA